MILSELRSRLAKGCSARKEVMIPDVYYRLMLGRLAALHNAAGRLPINISKLVVVQLQSSSRLGLTRLLEHQGVRLGDRRMPHGFF